jgi:predicted MFS family arabinose efflux permease
MLRELFHVKEASTGFYMSFGALGEIAGGVVVAKIWSNKNWQDGLVPSLVVAAAAIIMLVLIDTKVMPLIAFFIIGISLTYFFRSSNVAMQIAIPKDVFASWRGVFDAGGRIFGLIGIQLSALVFDLFGARISYGWMAGGLILSAFLWFFVSKDAVKLERLSESV